MKPSPTNRLEKLVSQAEQALSDSQAILTEVVDDLEHMSLMEDSVENKTQRLQLILQYRLDTQDALLRLVNLQQSLLQVLGIAPQHSSMINLERMAFALGHDDLNQILHALSQLLDALLKIAHRHHQRYGQFPGHKQRLRSSKAKSMSSKLYGRLKKAIKHQKQFISLTTAIMRDLEKLNKRAAIGPVLDHVAALKGPVSQFFQAIQNGLALSHRLYEKTNQTLQLKQSLGAVLQQADALLKQMPSLYQHHPLFTPVKTMTSEKLEQRASEKRLGHFFRH